MSLSIPTLNRQNSIENFEGSEAIFDQPFNEPLVHQLVTRYLAGARAGTKAQKTRSDVSGGGTKPWRQKGTGRARSGTTRSPIWRTGGVTFAARPRSYDQKLNKKMFRVGIKSILSELLRQERLVVDSGVVLESHKTKELLSILKEIDAKKFLIIVDSIDKNLALASRNLFNVEIIEALNLNPVSLISAEKVIVTPDGLKKIEECFV